MKFSKRDNYSAADADACFDATIFGDLIDAIAFDAAADWMTIGPDLAADTKLQKGQASSSGADILIGSFDYGMREQVTLRARPGDMIVRDLAGDLHLCRSDVFGRCYLQSS